MEKISAFLSGAEAADCWEVSSKTICYWMNAGTIDVVRHPMNDHQLFRRADLDSLLRKFLPPKKKNIK